MGDSMQDAMRRLPVVDMDLARLIRLRSHCYELAARINNGEVTSELVRDIRETNDQILELCKRIQGESR